MRPLLTAFLVAAASLRGAGLQGPAVALPPPSSDPALSLSEAVDRALANNFGVAVDRLSALRSIDSVQVADSAFDSVLTWSAGTSGSRAPLATTTFRAADTAVSVGRLFAWGGTLTVGAEANRGWSRTGGVGVASEYDLATSVAYSQPLLAGGWKSVNLAPLITARQSAWRSRLALRASALDLIRDAESAYWTLSAARALIALRESSLRSAESLLEQVKLKRELGDANVLEQLQAEADVASQKVAVLNARQSVDAAEMRLRRLLGRGAAEEVDRALFVQPLPEDSVPPPPDFRPWIAKVSDFDFGVAIELSNVETADTLVERARQNDNPDLRLNLSGSTAADPVAGFGDAYDVWRREKGWGNAVSLTLSLPRGRRQAESNRRLAERARRQAELRLADVRQALIFDARATWRDLESSRARVDAAATALRLQRQSYEGERERYQVGQSDLLRVIQSQAALDAAQLAWVQARLDARLASARTARLDGSILPRHGFTLDDVELRLADGGRADPLPPAEDNR
ncbi:MAG: TolC family protein [Opitutales bacterium]